MQLSHAVPAPLAPAPPVEPWHHMAKPDNAVLVLCQFSTADFSWAGTHDSFRLHPPSQEWVNPHALDSF